MALQSWVQNEESYILQTRFLSSQSYHYSGNVLQVTKGARYVNAFIQPIPTTRKIQENYS